MKILYLYSELMGYQIPVFKEYIVKYRAEVHVIHWDHKKLTPYVPPVASNIYYYNRSAFTDKHLKKFVLNLKPDIVYISGWMDKGYLLAVRPLRKIGIPVVTGIDDIWFKTVRQRIGALIFPFIRRIFFGHAWVAGPYQYEFAKKIGFKNSEIIFNCLSADIDIFNNAYNLSISFKKDKYPHRFLYVGRLESIKGVDILIKAWNILSKNELLKDWELSVIGNGSLHNYISSNSDINVLDFMQPELLVKEIEKTGCYILPSKFEPWALVLHEFSAAGLPIICSDVCGAAPVFVTPGYNGYIFESQNIIDLQQMMLKIINSTDDKLIAFSENSHKLGQRITPEIAAASFMSIL
jgi:glycosyltransferase involved in cell wall biosynthesis